MKSYCDEMATTTTQMGQWVDNTKILKTTDFQPIGQSTSKIHNAQVVKTTDKYGGLKGSPIAELAENASQNRDMGIQVLRWQIVVWPKTKLERPPTINYHAYTSPCSVKLYASVLSGNPLPPSDFPSPFIGSQACLAIGCSDLDSD
ncbi:hypothetical protein SUGI_0695180 [Cryptomeria japonica]|nr:hypothetical protein SUGI_0695180 [Cryptomeria japonica]